nr:MAG TPA: hypothetical protein [Caudoviricetes sp.]
MAKIRSINKSVCSMKLTVPYDGTIDINADGVVEVSDACAEALVNGTHDWEYADKAPKSNDTTSTVEDDEDTKIIAGIKKLSLEEMIETATEAGYPENEWKKFANNTKNAVKLMAAYLIKKYNESKLNADGEE